MQRQNFSSGTPWEIVAGYSRAVRVGNQVFVSGTTASQEDGSVVAVGDPYGQAKFILQKIETTLRQAGAELSDVVRTRMYTTDIERWEEICQAHREAFAEILPAATLVQVARLIHPDHLVEIEVDAVIPADSNR